MVNVLKPVLGVFREPVNYFFKLSFENFSLYSVKGLMPELLKPVLDVFREPVNYFFHVFHLFLSNPFPVLCSLHTYPPIPIHFKALFLSNMGPRSSFVFERLRDPFKAQRKAYEGKR